MALVGQDELWKYIPVGTLKALLAGLQDGDRLMPNSVGNLEVIRDHSDIAVIDIATEQIHFWADH